MGKIKDKWRKLIARRRTNIELRAANEFLTTRLTEQSKQIRTLTSHVQAAKDGRTNDVQAAMGILRERMHMDPTAPEKVDMLRQQLRQECAYVLYLEEGHPEGATEFNALPVQTRQGYFKRIDERAQ